MSIVFDNSCLLLLQGLVYVENDTLFESTGLYGQVNLHFVQIRVIKSRQFL